MTTYKKKKQNIVNETAFTNKSQNSLQLEVDSKPDGIRLRPSTHVRARADGRITQKRIAGTGIGQTYLTFELIAAGSAPRASHLMA